MTALEHLRLAAALGHAVPSSELRLRSAIGESIVVGSHPAADLHPCALRRVVQAFACPNRPDHSERIAAIGYHGSISELGGGVFRVAYHDAEQRWIPSLLRPERIAELLDGVGVDDLPDDAMLGRLKPDPLLGVTLLVLTANQERHLGALDAIAHQAAASIFLEELRCSLADRATHAPHPTNKARQQTS